MSEPGKNVVVVRRRDLGVSDGFRTYKLVLNGNIVGTIRNKQRIELEVPPGKHQLFLKIDWCRSNTIEFETDGEAAELECGSYHRITGSIFTLISVVYVLTHPKQYIWLKRSNSVSSLKHDE